jgi:HK97 family phage prohead protease
MQKTFKFELKDIGDAGTFVGMASVYGNKDLGGDVVEAGAFTKTLNDKNGEVPILWQHDMREPIGMGKLTDSADGLQIKGELALESPVAQKAHALLKKGVLKGLSIGYDTIRDEVKDKVRYLKELKLWEVSIVTFPMNELATVHGVKQIEDARILLAEFMEEEKQKFQALYEQRAADLNALADRTAALLRKDAPELPPVFDRIEQILRGAN